MTRATRNATDVDQLRRHRRVAIIGRRKLGKTREAAELIRRATEQDLVRQGQVFEPGPDPQAVSREGSGSELCRGLVTRLPVLLFLDDLPRHFSGKGLDALSTALEALRACKAADVVATVQTEQCTEEHRLWLAEQRFEIVDLCDLDESQTGRPSSSGPRSWHGCQFRETWNEGFYYHCERSRVDKG